MNTVLNAKVVRIVNIVKKQSIVLIHLDAELFTIAVIATAVTNVIIVKIVIYALNVKAAIKRLTVINVNSVHSVMVSTNAVSVRDVHDAL